MASRNDSNTNRGGSSRSGVSDPGSESRQGSSRSGSQAGQKGGVRVRELVEEGRESEVGRGNNNR
jgi:hypothetical protein